MLFMNKSLIITQFIKLPVPFKSSVDALGVFLKKLLQKLKHCVSVSTLCSVPWRVSISRIAEIETIPRPLYWCIVCPWRTGSMDFPKWGVSIPYFSIRDLACIAKARLGWPHPDRPMLGAVSLRILFVFHDMETFSVSLALCEGNP